MTAPETGFEQTGEWTTREEETAFLGQIASETDAVLTEAGRTVQDRPIHRVDLGSGSTMLIVCLQHGNEPASREGALMLIRDLAYSTDPAVLAYLATHRIVVVPNVNADRLGTHRNNVNNVNLNRDWWKLTQPETLAVQEVILDCDPSVMIDAHEYFADSHDWLAYPAGLPGTHPDIQAVAQTGYDAGVVAMTLAGHTSGYYPLASLPWAGLSTTVGASHAVGFLSETEAGSTPALRVEIQRLVFDMLIAWHEDSTTAIEAAHAASLANALTTIDPVPIMTRQYIGGGPITTADVSGYALDSPLPDHLITAHGITVDGSFVSINQPARLTIAVLCDPDSTDKVVTATRVPRIGLPTGEWVAAYVQTPIGRRTVIGAWWHDGAYRRHVPVPH